MHLIIINVDAFEVTSTFCCKEQKLNPRPSAVYISYHLSLLGGCGGQVAIPDKHCLHGVSLFQETKTDLLCGMFFYDWNLSPTNDLHRYGWCVIGAEWRILPDNIRGHLIFQPCSFALKIHKGICLKSTFLTFNCFSLGRYKRHLQYYIAGVFCYPFTITYNTMFKIYAYPLLTWAT